jgi:hypothetical protein
VREALAATTLVGGEPAAGIMATSANFAGLDVILRAHVTHHAMTMDEGAAFTKDRTKYLPVLGVSPFGQGPDDMAAFATIYAIIRKFTHMLVVGRYFGPQEDLGTMCILSVFTEDVDKIARTALDDATASDAGSYRLHSVLRTILQAYLQQKAGKEWRRLCEELVWPPVFSRGWTEAVRLHDLGGAIAALTATDSFHAKHLDVPLWARF